MPASPPQKKSLNLDSNLPNIICFKKLPEEISISCVRKHNARFFFMFWLNLLLTFDGGATYKEGLPLFV